MIQKATLQQVFSGSADVKFQSYTFAEQKVLFIYCEAMVDTKLLNEIIVPRVAQLDLQALTIESTILSSLYVPDLEKQTQLDKAIPLVYRGSLLLYFETAQLLFSTNIADKPNRSPEETSSEMIVKGPRDNFIEDISINIALIRKRLPTKSLYVEKLTLGRRSETAVAILYFEDIANLAILEEIKNQLQKIDTDIVFNGEILMEQVNKSTPIFPRTDYTGRPDFAIQALARGRFIVLVDGVAYAVITPVNFSLLFKTGEDNEFPALFSSLGRLLRVTGILVGTLLPAFWLALTTFHQNQLPFQLLATVVQANSGLPFPSSLEMLVMIGMFELFREAGFRLPSVIGGTIGVVGGLIIGDAAIRAGITSPAMVVVIATSTIATYTLVNQSFSAAVSILRVFFILFTAFFGLFGFFMSLFFTLTYLANMRTFGVPYLNIGADLSWSNFSKTFLRLPHKQYKERPADLKPQDKTRSKTRSKSKPGSS